jgi:phospholipid transport system substrate-binding protein
MISTLRRSLLVLLAALPLMASAAPGQSAHDLVQDTTNRMLADLSANKEKYKQDPTDFYAALNSIVGRWWMPKAFPRAS